MSVKKIIAGGFFAAAWTASACANEAADSWRHFGTVWEQGKRAYIIDIDNDSLLLRNNDGFYTSGARFTVQSARTNNGATQIAGWRLGHDIYTPSDIKLPPEQINPKDHPYAGWLYTGWFTQTYRPDGGYLKLGFDIGCIGPCAAGERVQTNLHRLINQPLPRGWSRQIQNEAGLVLYADAALRRRQLASWLDITPNLQARFGNIFTDAGVGLNLRAGDLNWSPDADTLHGFARVDVHAIGYDATLQGGYFSTKNVHTVTPKTWVGEIEAGLAWQSAPFGLRASVVRRSNEIRDLSNAIGAQSFARLQFSYTP